MIRGGSAWRAGLIHLRGFPSEKEGSLSLFLKLLLLVLEMNGQGIDWGLDRGQCGSSLPDHGWGFSHGLEKENGSQACGKNCRPSEGVGGRTQAVFAPEGAKTFQSQFPKWFLEEYCALFFVKSAKQVLGIVGWELHVSSRLEKGLELFVVHDSVSWV